VINEDWGAFSQLINHVEIVLDEGEVWQRYSFSAFFDCATLKPITITLRLTGKDRRFWAGHYGLKFSRISAIIKLLSQEEIDTPDPRWPRTRILTRLE